MKKLYALTMMIVTILLLLFSCNEQENLGIKEKLPKNGELSWSLDEEAAIGKFSSLEGKYVNEDLLTVSKNKAKIFLALRSKNKEELNTEAKTIVKEFESMNIQDDETGNKMSINDFSEEELKVFLNFYMVGSSSFDSKEDYKTTCDEKYIKILGQSLTKHVEPIFRNNKDEYFASSSSYDNMADNDDLLHKLELVSSDMEEAMDKMDEVENNVARADANCPDIPNCRYPKCSYCDPSYDPHSDPDPVPEPKPTPPAPPGIDSINFYSKKMDDLAVLMKCLERMDHEGYIISQDRSGFVGFFGIGKHAALITADKHQKNKILTRYREVLNMWRNKYRYDLTDVFSSIREFTSEEKYSLSVSITGDKKDNKFSSLFCNVDTDKIYKEPLGVWCRTGNVHILNIGREIWRWRWFRSGVYFRELNQKEYSYIVKEAFNRVGTGQYKLCADKFDSTPYSNYYYNCSTSVFNFVASSTGVEISTWWLTICYNPQTLINSSQTRVIDKW